MLTFHNIG